MKYLGCLYDSAFCPCIKCSMKDDAVECYKWRSGRKSCVMLEKEIGADELNRRTPVIEFKRQLLPQPPRDAHPHFCYIDTLIFYDCHNKEVWRERVPEADQLEPFQSQDEHYNRLDSRQGQGYIHVEYEEGYGWVLKFSITHTHAKRIWSVLFPQVCFGREIDFPVRDRRMWMVTA